MFILARYFQNRRYMPSYRLLHVTMEVQTISPTLSRPLPISERLLLLYSVTLQIFSLDTLSIVVERSLALKRLLTSSYFIIRQFKFLIFRTTMKCFQNYFLCFFKRLRINIIFKSVFYFLFCSLFLCIIKN